MMKKTLLIIAVVLSGILTQAQTLKGVTLGEVYEGAVHFDENGKKYIKSTVSGLDGRIIITTLNDGRVMGVAFVTTERTFSCDVDIFKLGVENDFNIEFNEISNTQLGGEQVSFYSAKDGDLSYVLATRDNGAINGVDVSFLIINEIFKAELGKEAR